MTDRRGSNDRGRPGTLPLGRRLVGKGQPCLIVAEAGSNHNGSLEQALCLIDVAAEAGADVVKFQMFRADRLYPHHAGESDYLRQRRDIFDIIRDMEMPQEWLPDLARHCAERGVAFLSSPFDEQSADLVDPFLDAFKIASYEITHAPLIRHVARKGKPMILSTGTADLDEVLRAVSWAKEEGNERLVLLQCTAKYPTPLPAVNVRAVQTLREATGLLVGLSDHSREPSVAPCAAVALGACVIEKHFTLSNRLPGPDHQFALEPHELAQMVRDIRATEQVLGHGRKELLPEEQELHAFARRSVFATRHVAKGEQLSPDNIAVLRCGKRGFGLPPERYSELLGKVAVRPIAADSLVGPGDFA